MNKFLAILIAILALPSLALAGSQETANFNAIYELDATSITYCVLAGKNGNPYDAGIESRASIVTSGSSATTSALVSSSAPFAEVAIGDIILVAGFDARVVVSKADSDTITVDTAWNLGATGVPFRWKKSTCGTASTNGWIDVAGADSFMITLSIEQVNVTGGIDVQVQCRGSDITKVVNQVFPACTTGACGTVQNYAGTAGITSTTSMTFTGFPYQQCRVGWLIHTSDDGGDTGANAERITASVTRFFSSR